MLAVVYARVSTDEQAERGSSLEDQVAACEARARSKGAIEVEVYRDVASGSVLQRPGLESVRRRIAAGGVGLFVCLDPDRLARNLSHQLLLTGEFERAGAGLEFVNFEWRDTPEGRLFYALRGAIAEYEREKIRERTIRGKIRRAEERRLTHNPRTYGYAYRQDDKSLAVDPPAAEVVRQVFRWYVQEDIGYHGIARRLNGMNLPSPRGASWTCTTVRRILANTAYAGVMHLRRYDAAGVKASRRLPPAERVRRRVRPEREWIPVPVPPIVDAETFQRAAEKRAVARRLHAGVPGAQYLLSGLTACGLCGRPLHGNRSGRPGRKRRYYVCAGRGPVAGGGPRCSLPFIPADRLEAIVWRVIAARAADPRLLGRDAAGAFAEALRPLQSELRALETQILDCQRQRLRVIELCQRGFLSVGELEARLRDLSTRTAGLSAAHAAVQRRMSGLGAGGPAPRTPGDVAEEIAAGAMTLDLEERRAIVRIMTRRVVVRPEAVVIEVRVDCGAVDHSDDALGRCPVDQHDPDLRKHDPVE